MAAAAAMTSPDPANPVGVAPPAEAADRDGAGALPPPLRQHLGRPLLVTRLGLLGGRTLLLTDHPALYLHDTGNLWSSERTVRLEPYELDREELVFAKRSTELKGAVELPELGTVTFDEASGIDDIGDGLSPASPERVTPLPVSVVCRFEAPDDVERAAAGAGPVAEALAEHLEGGELYANVEVAGGRLVLSKRAMVLCDLPISRLQATRSPMSVRIDAAVRIAGLEATSIEIHLPTAAMTGRLAAALDNEAPAALDDRPAGPAKARDAGPPQQRAAIDQVTAVGLLAEAAVDASGEAVLDHSSLSLTIDGAEHRFDFDDPELRVAGTGDRFVLLDGEAGPLRVSGASSHLLRQLATNEALRLAAGRTLEVGPFPCDLVGGGPVVVEVGGHAVTVRGLGDDRVLPATGALRQSVAISGGSVRLALASGDDEIAVTAPMELLGALHAEVEAVAAWRTMADRPDDLLRTIVALEGDYLLYTAVGAIVDAHGVLAAAHNGRGGPPELDTPLELPAGDAFIDLATDLMQGALEAERHLERVVHQLPAFLTNRDGSIVEPGRRPPVELKVMEARYRIALSGLRGPVAQLGAVHEPLRNALGLLGVEASTDYTAAAISGLAGAVINPIFLLSGASQALSARKHAGRLEADRLGGARRTAERSVERWNHLVASVVPAAAEQTVDSLFPLRWEVARQLSDRHRRAGPDDAGDLSRRLAKRLARLETFLAFPASDSVDHSRQLVVDRLKAAIAHLGETDRFAVF